MAKAIIMPKFGMTQEEATIVRWLKQEGERVEPGDPICEVTTDKINMEVEAPGEGVLGGIRFGEGQVVPVTEVIAYLLAEGEAPPPVGPTLASGAARLPAESPPPVPTPQPGTGLQPGAEQKPASLPQRATPLARRVAEAEAIELAGLAGSGPKGLITRRDVERLLAARGSAPEAAEAGGKRRASPAARRLARQFQVDLATVAGSGPRGRVQAADVLAAAAARQATDRAPAPAAGLLQAGQPEVIPLEGMRRTIALRMQTSAQQAPHIMLSLEIDMGRALALREQFNARLAGGKPLLSVTAMLVKACAAALREHPLLNSYFREDRILVMPQVNVGVAVALEEGLIVPVVRNADEKGLLQIAQEVNDLSQRARQGRLHPQEVADGTFTLSNLGMFGIDHFTAIINPPQVAILAVGRIARRFVPDEAGQPAARSMMTVTLSVDHRVVDGAGGARFLVTLREVLESAGAQWG